MHELPKALLDLHNGSAFVFVVPILWFAFIFILNSLLIQKFSLWGTLTEKYLITSEFYGEWLNGQSLRLGESIGSMKIGGVASIGFSNSYLYLKLGPKFFLPFVKPAQIPWMAIKSIEEKKILWLSYCAFVIDDIGSLMVRRSKKFNEYLSQNAGKAKILQDFHSSQSWG